MNTTQRTLRAVGLLTGIALAGLLVLALRVPASSGTLGANARMWLVPPGELTVPKQGFLRARDLVAGGGHARGQVRLRNITVGAVAVRLRLQPASRELDRALHVSLSAGGRTLASGSLGELRRWSRRLTIPQGGAESLRADLHLPPEAEDYAGRRADIRVEARTELLEAPK